MKTLKMLPDYGRPYRLTDFPLSEKVNSVTEWRHFWRTDPFPRQFTAKACWLDSTGGMNKVKQLKGRALEIGMPFEEYSKLPAQKREMLLFKHILEKLNRQREVAIMEGKITPGTTPDPRPQGKPRTKSEPFPVEQERVATAPSKLTPNGELIVALREENYTTKAVWGGARSGKTYGILQSIVDEIGAYRPEMIWDGEPIKEFKVYIGGPSFQVMKGSTISDFKLVMKDAGYWDDSCWNGSRFLYTCKHGPEVHFFTYESKHRQLGAACHIYFFNEADECDWVLFEQIARRAEGHGWIDFNPSGRFWYHERLLPHAAEWSLGELPNMRHEGNPRLKIGQRQNVDRDAVVNPDAYQIYGLGQFHETPALVFNKRFKFMKCSERGPDGEEINYIPHSARLVSRGLDWGGWAKNPHGSKMALVALYRYGDAILFDQELYESNISAQDVARILLNKEEQVPIFADMGNHQDGLDTIKQFGVHNIQVADKKSGSVRSSINYINSKTVYITERSDGIWNERKRYMWKKFANGTIDYDHVNPHSQQDLMDAMRYATEIARIGLGRDRQEDPHELQHRLTQQMSSIGRRNTHVKWGKIY